MLEKDDISVVAQNWGWRYIGRKNTVLEDISLQIPRGKTTVILGTSGSGKSTFLQAVAGVLGDEGECSGKLLVNGRDPRDCRGEVGLVLQDPDSQVVLERVGDDVAFGCENLGVEREEIWKRVSQAITNVGLQVGLDHSTQKLSGGQKQRLALAAVSAMQPSILALDEPTANIDPEGRKQLYEALKSLIDAYHPTVLLVEHRLDLWADLIDNALVFHKGKLQAAGSFEWILKTYGEDLERQGIWLPKDYSSKPLYLTERAKSQETCSPAIKVQDLAIGYEKPLRKPLSFEIPAGKSTCIVGDNGSGKTTLLLTLAGLIAPLEGTVEIFADALKQSKAPAWSKSLLGRSVGRNPFAWKARDYRGRLGVVFQEPDYQFLAKTVEDELSIGLRNLGLSPEEQAQKIDETCKRLGLSALRKAHPMTLSGGEKRRLSVATALIAEPPIVLLDEPTFGQDRRTWHELVAMLRELRDGHVTLVSVSHDEDFCEALGDNILDFSPSAKQMTYV